MHSLLFAENPPVRRSTLSDEIDLGLFVTGSLFGCVFRPKPATHSDGKRPLIPAQTGRPFRR